MAELTPIEKLKIIEDDFQKWFRKAYELKDYTDVDTDLLVRDLPGAKSSTTIQRHRYYDTLFKNSIKVPPQYQDTPNLFINALGKYFVDFAKFLYKDQIRYGYTGFQSSNPGDWSWIDVYKSCGDEVGCFCLSFQLEGNLVIAEVGYQIYDQLIPLCSNPSSLNTFNSESLAKSGRREIFSYVPKLLLKIDSGLSGRGWYLVTWILCFPIMGLVLLIDRDIAKGSWYFYFFIPLASIFPALFLAPFFIWIFELLLKCFSDPEIRVFQQETAIEQDLSPIHFPVKYFDHDDLNEAYTNSHDHQMFFKQLEAVVNQMSALGESANRAE